MRLQCRKGMISRKKLSSALQNKTAIQGEPECPEKLVEVDGGGYPQHCDLIDDSTTSMEIDEPTLSGEVEALQENSFSQCSLTPLAATETAVQIDVELDEHKNLAEANSTTDCSCETAIQHLGENQVLEISPRCSPRTVVGEKNHVELDEHENLAEASLIMDCSSATAIQHPDETPILENSPRCSPRTITEEKNSIALDVELDEHTNLAEANSTMDFCCETAIQHVAESQELENSPRCNSRTITEEKNSIALDVELDERTNLAEANSTMDFCCETAIQHLAENQELENSPRCSPRTVVDEKNAVELDRIDYADEPADVGAYSKTVMEEKIVLVRKELDKARERLSSSSEIISEFGVLENAIIDVEKLSRELEATKNLMQLKQQEIGSLTLDSSEVQERTALIYNKLTALKVSLSSVTSSIAYFEQREARARSRVEASMSSLEQKKEILARLQVQGDETNAKRREIQEAESELRKKHLLLKSKLAEENRRLESERVLFAIDNVDKAENLPSQTSWKLGSKATDLLKSEEDKIKLQNEIKQSREKLGAIKKEIEELNWMCQKVDNEIQAATLEMDKASKVAKETELGLQNVIHEKEALLEMRDNGKTEIDNLIAEYQQSIFEESIREEELKILGEDMQIISTKFDELRAERAASASKANKLLNGDGSKTGLPSEKMRQELRDVWDSILEAESLLSSF